MILSLGGGIYKLSPNGLRLCDGAVKYAKSFYYKLNFEKYKNLQTSESSALLQNRCACCTTQIYKKNLCKNGIFRKLKYARKEEFYATIICFGQFIRPSSRG